MDDVEQGRQPGAAFPILECEPDSGELDHHAKDRAQQSHFCYDL